MLLAGKVAYVSGAAGTIGGAIARRLAEEGAAVVLGDVDVAGARRAADALRDAGLEASAVAHDVTDRAAAVAACDATLERHGRVDIACANAGIGDFAPVLQMPDELWRRTLDINVTGVLHTLQAFGAPMVAQGSGSLIVTASISSLRGAPLLGAYCASKFAVMGLAESLATEIASAGVRVNCVCPGPVEGAMVDAMVERTAAEQRIPRQQALAELTAPIAFGRLVQPVEVADACVYLACDLSSFVTGQRLVVDGGMLAK